MKASLVIPLLALACGVAGLARAQQYREPTLGSIHFFVDPAINSDDPE
jgi:hypothetical protein